MPGPQVAGLKREEAARGARERKAITAYLRGLQRTGARTPGGTGLLAGVERAAARERPPARAVARGATAGLAGLSDLDLALLQPIATHTPPYLYAWTWTKWIFYAPGTLSAHADKTKGTFGFDIASDHDSNQVNKSRARAGVGVRFQPAERGLLTIRPKLDVNAESYLKWNMRVARAFAWRGVLVQAFDTTDDELASTPMDARKIEFDRHGGGGPFVPLFVEAEFTVTLPGDGGVSLFVDPSRWYAIWLWCGGGIRAAGWQTVLGVNVGSDAASRLEIGVSSIALYFAPIVVLGGSR